MNAHYTYFAILAASLAGPLLLSFDRKVAFYKKWAYLFPAMLLPALFYIIWDIYFTRNGVWSFNDNYITGIKLYGLPVEEVLFFFVVPYCCVFIYACIRAYFPLLVNKRSGNLIFILLALALLVTGVIFYQKSYTAYTFIFTAFFMTILVVAKKYFSGFDATAFLAAYIIILIPFLIVNGFLTVLPVVLYNNAENLGVRLYTIPFEDVFYGMLLILMNVALYERLQNKKAAD